MRNVSREVKKALNESLQEESFIDSNVPSQENKDIANDFINKNESIYETLAKEIR
jgi:HKD family nuclease